MMEKYLASSRLQSYNAGSQKHKKALLPCQYKELAQAGERF